MTLHARPLRATPPDPLARPAATRIAEVDGLRGIALTLVVVFHLFGHGRVSGGVDVFLTVSGFLLVLSLGRALRDGRPLGIVARWARTFARLAPPAAVVLLAITALTFTVYSPWLREQNLVEVVSSALYVENWQLISSQLSYGAAGPQTSPLQHFWSLSVQAQFFLVFPLLASVVLFLRARSARTLVFWTLLAAATAASFAYAWHLNALAPSVAYFHSLARFWELGAGGLLAAAVLAGWRLPRPARVVAGWAGLAMILASGFLFDGGAAYPGPAALVPVGGAALVLLSAEGGPGSPSRLLSSRPLRELDAVSYGLYLWHWPLLIAFFTIKGRDELGWRGALVVLGASALLAVLTRVALSRPIARVTGQGMRRSLAVALVAIAVAAVPAGVAAARAQADPPAVALDSCAGAATLDPARPDCRNADFAGEMTPALEDLRRDDANRAECWGGPEVYEMRLCALGETEGYSARILAVGDSHNNVFLDVYEDIAEARGWRIDASGRAGCKWVAPETPISGKQPEDEAACRAWRTEIGRLAASGDYDAILTVASSKHREKPVDPDQSPEEYHTEITVDAWADRGGAETPILALVDNPIFPEDALGCLADPAAVEAGECELPRREALKPTGIEEAVAQTENAYLIDLTDLECDIDVCRMVQGGVIVTRDGAHLTASYAATLAPYLDRALGRHVG
ncbi:acyltransferase family protein [Microbacterium excoecariae]|uniref:acyltransferase family protein n=1 Tax=Microbacterium excoecariae TaxID=2715210 RepID=UPI00140830AD|nr:acyltransferase [Microbacterium excoecariae]